MRERENEKTRERAIDKVRKRERGQREERSKREQLQERANQVRSLPTTLSVVVPCETSPLFDGD